MYLNIKQTDAITDVSPCGVRVARGARHITPRPTSGGVGSSATPYLDPDDPICLDPVESGSAVWEMCWGRESLNEK